MGMKIKVGDTVRIVKSYESKQSLDQMGIGRKQAGRLAVITQVAEAGVSFEFANKSMDEEREFHLGASHVLNVFPND